MYAGGQTKTTLQVEQLKEELYGKVVLYSVGFPSGARAVDDMENLTAEWLEKMSQGGGFMIDAHGTLEEGKKLFEKLELC